MPRVRNHRHHHVGSVFLRLHLLPSFQLQSSLNEVNHFSLPTHFACVRFAWWLLVQIPDSINRSKKFCQGFMKDVEAEKLHLIAMQKCVILHSSFSPPWQHLVYYSTCYGQEKLFFPNTAGVHSSFWQPSFGCSTT